MTTAPKPHPPRKRGRPSKFSPQLADVILARLAEGESLSAICRDQDMPCRKSVLDWLVKDAEFLARYTRARLAGADVIAETALEQATVRRPAEEIPSARLAFDARRWYAGKIAPRHWGEKVLNEHSGPDGSPVQLQPVAPPMVPREIAAGIKALLGKAEIAAGLPASVAPDAQRLKAILATGAPPHPDLYECLWRAKNA